MRFITGSILALLLATSSVYGQINEVIVDSSSMPGTDVLSVAIDELGTMTITSKDGDYEIARVISDGDVSINSFKINNLTTAIIEPGSNASVSWGTTSAASCSASTNPVGDLAGWGSGTAIGTTGPKTVAFPSAGVFNLKLDCVGTNGSTDSAVVTAKVGSASITRFTVSPDSADRGTSVAVTLNWASENAESLGCSGSPNWPNSSTLPATGSRSFTISSLNADQIYTLTCFGAYDEDVKTAKLTAVVEVKDPPTTCTNPSLTSSKNYQWTQVFNTSWPGPKSQQSRVTIPTYGYLSLEFVADATDAGLFTNIEASGTTGTRLGAISRCPGDFDVAAECKFEWRGGTSGGIVWDTTNQYTACQLVKGETYYWNMTFTDGVTPGTSSCIGSYCETYMRNWNADYD